MRCIVVGLALTGCAAEGAGLMDTGTGAQGPPEPPPGAVETRYTFDCTTLDFPEIEAGGVHDLFAHTTVPVIRITAAIPGFALDSGSLPLDMAIFVRASDRLLDYADNNGLDIEQGVERWRSDVTFDANGHAIIECGVLPACIEYPCDAYTDETKPNWPVLVGWTEAPIELIVWTEPESE